MRLEIETRTNGEGKDLVLNFGAGNVTVYDLGTAAAGLGFEIVKHMIKSGEYSQVEAVSIVTQAFGTELFSMLKKNADLMTAPTPKS